MKELNCYTFGIRDDEYFLGFVIATSVKEAKNYIVRNGLGEITDYDDWFLDLRVKLKINCDVEGLKLFDNQDTIESTEQLIRGFFSSIEYQDCPRCNSKDVTLYYQNNQFFCSSCE